MTEPRFDYEPGLDSLRRGSDGPPRRRRRSPLKPLIKPLLLILLGVGVPTLVAVWVGASPRFEVREVLIDEIVVEGEARPVRGTAVAETPRIDPAWVHWKLRPFVGENLPRLDLDAVEAALGEHIWLRSATLRKELPGRLAVRLVEKRAVALLREDDDLIYLDAAGRTIAPLDTTRGADGLLLISRRDPELAAVLALEFESELLAADPVWGREISEIEILGQGESRIFIRGLPFPLLVRSGTLESRTAPLRELLPQIVARYAAVESVDLRYARQIIVRPTGTPPVGDVHLRGRNG